MRSLRQNDNSQITAFAIALLLYPLLIGSGQSLFLWLREQSEQKAARVLVLSEKELEKILPQKKIFNQEPKKPLIQRAHLKKTPSALKANIRPKKAVEQISGGPRLSLTALSPKGNLSEENIQAMPIIKSPQSTQSFGLVAQESDIAQSKDMKILSLQEQAAKSEYKGGLTLKAAQGEDLQNASSADLEVSGGLTTEVIQTIVEEHLIEIRYCYEKALIQDKELQGTMLSLWSIDPMGAISSLNLASDDMGSNDLVACMSEKMKAWKFPEPKRAEEVHVKYPFRFRRVGGLSSVDGGDVD